MARRIIYKSKKKEEKKSPLEINQALVKGAAWSNYQTGGESSLDDGDWNVNAFEKAFDKSYAAVRGRLAQKENEKANQNQNPGTTINNIDNRRYDTQDNRDYSQITNVDSHDVNIEGGVEGNVQGGEGNVSEENIENNNTQVEPNEVTPEPNKTIPQTDDANEEEEGTVEEPIEEPVEETEEGVEEPVEETEEEEVVDNEVEQPVDDGKTTEQNVQNVKSSDVQNTNTTQTHSHGIINPDYPEIKYAGDPIPKRAEGTTYNGKRIPTFDKLIPNDKDGVPVGFNVRQLGFEKQGYPVYEITYGKGRKKKTIEIDERTFNQNIAPYVKSTGIGSSRQFYRNDTSSPQELAYAKRNRDKRNRSSNPDKASYTGKKAVYSGFLGSDFNRNTRYSKYNYTDPGAPTQQPTEAPTPAKYNYNNKEKAINSALKKKSYLRVSPFKYKEPDTPLYQMEAPLPGGELPQVDITAESGQATMPMMQQSTIWDAMAVITPDKVKKMTEEYINNLSLFGDEKSVETLGSDAKMEIGRYMNEQKEMLNQVMASGDPNSQATIEKAMMNLKKIASKFNVIAENKALWIEGKTEANFSKGSRIDNMFMADLVYSESPAVNMAIKGGDSPEIYFKMDGVDKVYGSSALNEDVFQVDLESMGLYGTAVQTLRRSASNGERYSEGMVDALVSQMAKNKQAQLSFLWDGEDHLGLDIAGHLSEMYGSEVVSALHPNHKEFDEGHLEDVVKIALKSYLKREFDNAKPQSTLSAEQLIAKYSGLGTKGNFGMTSEELIEKYS